MDGDTCERTHLVVDVSHTSLVIVGELCTVLCTLSEDDCTAPHSQRCSAAHNLPEMLNFLHIKQKKVKPALYPFINP